MKDLSIEWRRYTKEGTTCDRCAGTGNAVRSVIRDLQKELGSKGITITLIETELPEEEIAQSNILLFNGVPLEEVLQESSAGESDCPSCACLTNSRTACRTVQYQGTAYEEIPPHLIRAAALRAAGITP